MRKKKAKKKAASARKTSSGASDWLSVVGVASHLGISKETVYRWLEAKTVPSYRVGKLWKFHRPEIDAWVKSGGSE